MMRLKAEIWVKAYVRRCNGDGANAVVARHGDDDAGAIYIKVTRGDRMAHIYAPAPAGIDEAAGDRRWVSITGKTPMTERDADARLERELRFDSDMWLVEVEDRDGRHFLDDWLLEEGT
ncbi:MAG: DUF1491 family protein [Hyphomicrobiaceae bacterium]